MMAQWLDGSNPVNAEGSTHDMGTIITSDFFTGEYRISGRWTVCRAVTVYIIRGG